MCCTGPMLSTSVGAIKVPFDFDGRIFGGKLVGILKTPDSAFAISIAEFCDDATPSGNKAASLCPAVTVAQPQLALWSSVASVMPWPAAESFWPRDDGLRPTDLPAPDLSPRQRGLRVVPRTVLGEKMCGPAADRTNGGVPGASASPIYPTTGTTTHIYDSDIINRAHSFERKIMPNSPGQFAKFCGLLQLFVCA